jgi:hypothetical protein
MQWYNLPSVALTAFFYGESPMSAAGGWYIDVPAFNIKGATLDLHNDGPPTGARQILKGGMKIRIRNPIYDAWEDNTVHWKVDFQDDLGEMRTADFEGKITGNMMQGCANDANPHCRPGSRGYNEAKVAKGTKPASVE